MRFDRQIILFVVGSVLAVTPVLLWVALLSARPGHGPGTFLPFGTLEERIASSLLVLLLLGVAAGSLWLDRRRRRQPPEPADFVAGELPRLALAQRRLLLETGPPRRPDDGILSAFLGGVFPRNLRVLGAVTALMTLVMVGAVAALMAAVAGDRLEKAWDLLWCQPQLVQGQVLEVEARRSRDGATVTTAYQFTDPVSGRTFQEVSFSSTPLAVQGQDVTIEVLPGNPAVSRIQGGRVLPMPPAIPGLLLVVMLLLLGGVPLIYRQRRRELARLVERGVVREGRLTAVTLGGKGQVRARAAIPGPGGEHLHKLLLPVSSRIGPVLLYRRANGLPVQLLALPDGTGRAYLVEPHLR
ncbi:MAG: DUF3592 domain-containing protein [Thermodesulfobacteriota bacterium]